MTAFSRHAKTKLTQLAEMKRTVQFTNPYPVLSLYGILWRESDGEHYVDRKELMASLGKRGLWRKFDDMRALVRCIDLGLVAGDVEKVLRRIG